MGEMEGRTMALRPAAGRLRRRVPGRALAPPAGGSAPRRPGKRRAGAAFAFAVFLPGCSDSPAGSHRRKAKRLRDSVRPARDPRPPILNMKTVAAHRLLMLGLQFAFLASLSPRRAEAGTPEGPAAAPTIGPAHGPVICARVDLSSAR